MVKNVFVLNVTQRNNMQSTKRKMLVPALSAILLASLLAGCQTTRQGIPTVGTVNISSVQCWPKKITYSKKDTEPTKGQVREHNATGRNIGCWE